MTIEAQKTLAAHSWPEGVSVNVRMALHTGEPKINASGYLGIDVHHTARLCSAAHGGQVLISRTTYDLIKEYGVNHIKYWYDESTGRLFCFVEAPDAETAEAVHREAHGILADEIFKVKEGV